MKFIIKEVEVHGHSEALEFVGHLRCGGFLDYRNEGNTFALWSCVEIGEAAHSHEEFHLGVNHARQMPLLTYYRARNRLKEWLWDEHHLKPGCEVHEAVAAFGGRSDTEMGLITIHLDEPYPVIEVR